MFRQRRCCGWRSVFAIISLVAWLLGIPESRNVEEMVGKLPNPQVQASFTVTIIEVHTSV
jgi:hypothetical protein